MAIPGAVCFAAGVKRLLTTRARPDVEMSKNDRSDQKLDAPPPWSVPIQVGHIPEAGLHQEIEAGPAQLAAMTALAGVREISKVTAAFDVTPAGGGEFFVRGRLTGSVGQNCAVTLEPVDTIVDEVIDLVFAPEAKVREIAKLHAGTGGEDTGIPDPPEPIVNGIIDLGVVASDSLFLGIDPYPRKPDAVFQPPAVAEDPEDHPFAALRALKQGSDSAESGQKPKRR